MAGCGEGLAGVLGQAEPDLAGGPVHPAGGHVGRVEEVGLEARRAEGAGQLDAVVERCRGSPRGRRSGDRRSARAMKSWPQPAESDGRRLRLIRRIGRKPSRMKWISGISSFSSRPPVSWWGIPLARSAPSADRNAAIRARASGASRTSASRKTSRGCRASRASDPAGVLLAAPAGGQLGRGDQADPLVGRGQLARRSRPSGPREWSSRTTHLELDALVRAARAARPRRSRLPRRGRGSGPRWAGAPRPGRAAGGGA